MARRFRLHLAAVLAVITCAVGFASCGGSSPSAHSSPPTTSPPPGPNDVAICVLLTKATQAYAARQFPAWRSDMSQIAGLADSAQYTPVKEAAEQVKEGLVTTTTTTRPKKKKKGVDLGTWFSTLGGYVALQHVCADLPSS